MSRRRLREWSGCNSSLTLSKVKREWRLCGRVLEATEESLTQSQPSEESHVSWEGSKIVFLQCLVIGQEQLEGSVTAEALGQLYCL